jgi:hypothetical protein
MVVPGSGQPPKLIDLVMPSQLVSPPPARRIVGFPVRRPQGSHVLSL